MKVDGFSQHPVIFLDVTSFFRQTLGLTDRALSNSYFSLRSYLQAGFPIRNAFAQTDFSGVLTLEEKLRIEENLAQGRSLAEILPHIHTFPPVDRACILGAEKSGHLPEVFEKLAQRRELEANLRRDILSRSLYPVLLIHLAAFVFPIGSLAQGHISHYLSKVAGSLFFIYLFAILFFWGMKVLPNSSFAEWFYKIPILGRFRRDLEISGFAAAFGELYEAGVDIVESYRISSAAVSSAWTRAQLEKGLPALESRQTFSQAIANTEVFAPSERQMLETGEISGSLGASLHRVERLLRERGERGMVQFSAFLTGGIYLFALLWVASGILTYYTNAYSDLDKLIK